MTRTSRTSTTRIDVDSLILSIHAASLTPNGWTEAGLRIAESLSASGVAGLRGPTAMHRMPWAMIVGMDVEAVGQYSVWAHEDLWFTAAKQIGRIRCGAISVSEELISAKELVRSAFYQEYLKPLRVGRMLNVCLAGASPSSSFGLASINFYREMKESSFGSPEITLLGHLAPHLSIAARVHWAAQSLQMLSHAKETALDSVGTALFALDSLGRVIFENETGRTLIARRRWIDVSNGELTAAKTVVERDDLRMGLRKLMHGYTFQKILTDMGSGAQAIVSGAPITAHSPDWVHSSSRALVWVASILPSGDATDALKRLFVLTSAEARMVQVLARVFDLRKAAEQLNVSYHTARAQLKSVFRKTGRRSQLELLALLAGLSTHPRSRQTRG